ncbi:MAG: hypothetical protein J5586_07620 [Clostridia bacterium]|nr:hypothetical protein [Clostridia bacterium]
MIADIIFFIMILLVLFVGIVGEGMRPHRRFSAGKFFSPPSHPVRGRQSFFRISRLLTYCSLPFTNKAHEKGKSGQEKHNIFSSLDNPSAL